MMPSQRKLSTPFFLLVISICVSIPAFAFQNEPDGFRGIKWGTNISELPDMSLSEEYGNSKFYLRKGEKLKIGDADIDRIGYGFYKGLFYSVGIMYNGSLNFKKLKAIFVEQYGQAQQQKQFGEHYSWLGETVKIAVRYNEIARNGDIWYVFKPLEKEQEKDDEQKAKKGAKDL
jgi:hypothetical protein